ncbi:MAG: helix-turn-helix domain-containing protein [Clostridia bacterium]|nr:helix-turn-helix domain-containing protein [Clostridia bacterium]
MENIMTLEQAANYLKLAPRKLAIMARKNEIPNKKVGQKRLFVKELIDEWLKTA